MRKKLRLKIQLVLWNNDKKVFSRCLMLKDRVMRAIQVRMWNKAYLKVNYGNGVYNDGLYYDFRDLRKALSVFTEASLITYLMSKEK